MLRRANNLTSDHLLMARRTVIIPGDYYKGGVSLSPRPVEGEDEERRKAAVRRWMVACKVSEYVCPYLDFFELATSSGSKMEEVEKLDKETVANVPVLRRNTDTM